MYFTLILSNVIVSTLVLVHWTEAFVANAPLVNLQGFNPQGVNHQEVNHQAVNHQGVNHQAVNHQEVNHQAVNHHAVHPQVVNPPVVSAQVTNPQLLRRLHHAIVILRGQSSVFGELRFRENPEGRVNIRGTIEGLTKGPHGMHIHQFGDLSKGCKSAGGHFDAHRTLVPHGAGHGLGHTGDFGNIIAGDTGVANIYINDSLVALHGEASIVGRAVLVHAGPDDLGRAQDINSHLTGNAGTPVACGIVAWDD